MIVAFKNLDDTESLRFYKYVYESGDFQEESFTKTKSYEQFYIIKNLVANDLNSDGYLDLIVTVYDSFDKNYYTEVHLFDEKQNAYVEVFKKRTDGVFIGDFDGNKKVELMYFDKFSGQRKIVNFVDFTFKEILFSTYFLNRGNLCDGNEIYSKVSIPVDHSSAFVDLDADCQNDLVIHSRDEKFDPVSKKTFYTDYLEIWRGVMENDVIKYCLAKSSAIKIEDKLGPFTVADLNRDGLLDLVFPILGTSKILIAYNQMKLKFNWYDDYCETHRFNTTASSFPILFSNIKKEQTDNTTNSVIINLTDNPDEVFYQDKNFPPIIRVGDINADSFPDLITVKRIKADQTITRVYLNVRQDPEDPLNNIRTFNQNHTYTLPVNNSIFSSFFDLDENGQLDLIIVSKENSGYKINGFYNNYIYDAFFLKSETLLTKDIFYSNEIGVNYRYISTNLNGNRRMDINYQMIQLGTNYLNMPYSYIGIGRSNNYIENFHVISTSFAKGYLNYKIFTPIIPNSGLIITKQIENNPSNPQSINWELDLIVKPTSQLFILIITIVIILVVILAIIIYLHIKEVQEDEKEKDFKWF